jgi:formiminotetrahydrofolate cyclodeaminase
LNRRQVERTIVEAALNQAESEPSKARSIDSYAEALASGSPTPGGGSASAVVASLAAALAEMVCNLTIGGKTPPSDVDSLTSAAGEAGKLRLRLLDLATADEAAFGGFMHASTMSKTTDDEKATRRAALDRALINAADVPLAIAGATVDVLSLLSTVAERGTRHALSDASTAALLAEAAARSALLNVDINAGLMRDAGVASSYRTRSDELELRARRLSSGILDTVNERSTS